MYTIIYLLYLYIFLYSTRNAFTQQILKLANQSWIQAHLGHIIQGISSWYHIYTRQVLRTLSSISIYIYSRNSQARPTRIQAHLGHIVQGMSCCVHIDVLLVSSSFLWYHLSLARSMCGNAWFTGLASTNVEYTIIYPI